MRFGEWEAVCFLFRIDLDRVWEDRPRLGEGEDENSLLRDALEGVVGDRPRLGEGEDENSLLRDALEGVVGDRPCLGEGEDENSLPRDALEGVVGDRPRLGEGEDENSLLQDALEGVVGDRPRFGEVVGDRPRFVDKETGASLFRAFDGVVGAIQDLGEEATDSLFFEEIPDLLDLGMCPLLVLSANVAASEFNLEFSLVFAFVRISDSEGDLVSESLLLTSASFEDPVVENF
ncbi:hypothetical protein PPACK8108_LOCUS11495 [Phakopsora pachyrhizi]|uniref:Uncharacterized protein n=1 Tax=Phakopsora pachyrhizi TaxID=170000 RepID=A0AAV0B3Q7_PHAPC|nr:hypothetical protein PPACK8108_LOCUS11495 [Phakopsora pachyrhizi]